MSSKESKARVVLKYDLLCVGHMHLKGCYDWFRPPKTKYEIWKDQHEKKKRKREQQEREQEI